MQLQGLPPGELQGRECKQYPLSRLLFQSWGRTSLVAQKIKNLPALWETWVWSLGREGNDNPLQHSCLGQSHGQKSLAGYSPQGCKASDTSELPTVSRVGEHGGPAHHRKCPVVIPNPKDILSLKTSVMVQWLRLCAPSAGGLGWIPGRGTSFRMLHMHAATRIWHVTEKVWCVAADNGSSQQMNK